MERRVRAGLTKAEGRKFAIPVGLAFLALAGLTLWRGHGTVASAFGGIGTLLILAGVAIPTKLGPIYRAWMGLALAISKVTTPIFMGIVFYLVLTPTGILMRLLGRNPLQHDVSEDSYWIPRSGERPRTSDMNRQF